MRLEALAAGACAQFQRLRAQPFGIKALGLGRDEAQRAAPRRNRDLRLVIPLHDCTLRMRRGLLAAREQQAAIASHFQRADAHQHPCVGARVRRLRQQFLQARARRRDWAIRIPRNPLRFRRCVEYESKIGP